MRTHLLSGVMYRHFQYNILHKRAPLSYSTEETSESGEYKISVYIIDRQQRGCANVLSGIGRYDTPKC